MNLYLIRHATAEPRHPGALDADRALTYEGKSRFEQTVVGLGRLGVSFDAVYHSPWRRAVQTAALLQPLLVDGEPRALGALATSPSTALISQLEGAHVALVGHEPWMSDLAAMLCLGPGALGGAFLFKKGGVAWFEGQARLGGMVLRAFFPPKSLRLLGRGCP